MDEARPRWREGDPLPAISKLDPAWGDYIDHVEALLKEALAEAERLRERLEMLSEPRRYAAEIERLRELTPEQVQIVVQRTSERDEARAEVARLREALRSALDGELEHAYNGRCPDSLNPTDRDSDCPACRALEGTTR